MKERLYLFDTTLRDGQQTPGIDFSLEDKIAIAQMLDELGIDYVEGGYPGANPTDTAFFADEAHGARQVHRLRHDQARRPLGVQRSWACRRSCRRKRRRRSASSPRAGIITCGVALGCTNEENLESIRASVAAAVAAGKEAMVDCEHFFDGYKANPDYALACAEAALRGRRALGRALRHQWRHAARRGARRSSTAVVGVASRRPARHPRP